MTTEELKALAECVTAAWEDIEGESLRDGHKQTMENLIFKTLQQVNREVQRRTREEDAKIASSYAAPGDGSRIGETPYGTGWNAAAAAISEKLHALLRAEEDSER